MRGPSTPGIARTYGAGTSAAVGNNIPVPQGQGGMRAGGAQVAPVPVTQLFSGLYGSILGAPLMWLFGLIGLLVLYKLIEEHRGGRETFAEIKVGLHNVIKVGLMAVVFLVVFKFLFTRYQVPGLSSIAAAA